jgi:ribulose-5-phosphate 4-epimerase/fuculose-1-phosphate aldolase
MISSMTSSIREQVSPEEWQQRVELAAAYRLVALHGWDDMIFTHISARVPGPEHHFLINPYGVLFEEIKASMLVKIDLDGNAVSQSNYPINPAGFVIHSAIHGARPDARCVLHLHTPYGQAVAAQAAGLLPITQTAMTLHGDIAYHEYEGLANSLDERKRLVADLGQQHCLILRNHGTLTVGEQVGDAFLRMYFLERACQAQVLALSGGAAIHPAPAGTPEITAEQANFGLTAIGRVLAWPALMRKLDRLDPSYRD